jgi:hypothetical protein
VELARLRVDQPGVVALVLVGERHDEVVEINLSQIEHVTRLETLATFW